MDAGVAVNLNDAWCSDKGDIFVVGDDGIIIYGKTKKFPWGRFLPQIIDNAVKAKEKEKKEK